MNYLIRWC